MIKIQADCVVCLTKKNAEIEYDELASLRGLINKHFVRIGNKFVCMNCYKLYQVAKEEMTLRHEEEENSLLDNLPNQ